jgi:hypothetical protein
VPQLRPSGEPTDAQYGGTLLQRQARGHTATTLYYDFDSTNIGFDGHGQSRVARGRAKQVAGK